MPSPYPYTYPKAPDIKNSRVKNYHDWRTAWARARAVNRKECRVTGKYGIQYQTRDHSSWKEPVRNSMFDKLSAAEKSASARSRKRPSLKYRVIDREFGFQPVLIMSEYSNGVSITTANLPRYAYDNSSSPPRSDFPQMKNTNETFTAKFYIEYWNEEAWCQYGLGFDNASAADREALNCSNSNSPGKRVYRISQQTTKTSIICGYYNGEILALASVIGKPQLPPAMFKIEKQQYGCFSLSPWEFVVETKTLSKATEFLERINWENQKAKWRIVSPTGVVLLGYANGSIVPSKSVEQ